MSPLIEIASPPEGGGQVLRSALTLSILTGQEVLITNIRAGRPKPGLQPQHIQAVKAAAALCEASVEGVAAGAQRLQFAPGTVKPGGYTFEIHTAGAASLVLQTVFLPLSQAPGSSHVTITGGTHVPWSPSFHYLEWQWLPFLRRLGFEAGISLEQAGFYPQGRGRLQATLRPTARIAPLNLLERGALLRINGLSCVANLEEDIARRQKLQALRRLEPRCRETRIRTASLPSLVKGTSLTLLAEFEHGQACFGALGAPGKRAESVADEAVDELEAFLEGQGAVDHYLADQLLLPLAFASGPSCFRTSHISDHLRTNAAVIARFLPARIELDEASATVSVFPRGNPAIPTRPE